MTSLGRTIAALQRRRPQHNAPSRLQPLQWQNANPGGLKAFYYLPKGLKPQAPLVVVLHGCTQDAAGYDHGAGWSSLADREGFALLFPEQDRANNPNLCFNWFNPQDAARDAGEAKSIRGMVAAMLSKHDLDPASVHITGLSAGGAMAATMLATYPEVFASGAVIAGLPHGVAADVPQAFAAMHGRNVPGAAALQAKLASAYRHKGPWPRLSIWHGGADRTVVPSNADALFSQWQGVHAVTATPDTATTLGGATHRTWRNAQGTTIIERWDIPAMAHGTPIAPSKDGLGNAMPFMLETGISSTAHIAAFFGIAGQPAKLPSSVILVDELSTPPAPARPPALANPLADSGEASSAPQPAPGHAVGKYVEGVLDRHLSQQTPMFASIRSTISEALRKAGLG